MENISRSKKIKELYETKFYKAGELELLQDEILDDLYLKLLITSDRLSIKDCEKPCVINYPWRPTRFIEINKSLYDNYVDANKDNANGIAVYSFENGRTLKHGELKELTDAFARGLLEYGIDINSKVGIMANDAFEEPMGLLSPNELGARVKFLDYFKSPFDTKVDVEKGNIDILFIDEAFLVMEPIINEKGVPVVVLNATRDYANTKYIPFDKVVSLGASKMDNELKKHKSKVDLISHDSPVLEIKSSGTTGAPKTILHSHNSINSSTQKLYFTGFPFGRDTCVLKSIPSQLGLGSLTTLYAGLVSGTGIILIRPASKEEAFKQNVQVIKNFKDIREKCGLSENAILMDFCSPMFIRGIEDDIDQIDDMSHVGGFLAAGAKMTKQELAEFNEANKKRGCTVPITNAYGQNELAGGVTMNTPKHDVPGTAGYPVIGTDVIIVDQETFEKLPNGTIGKILERSSSKFLGYDGMEERTKKATITLADGTKWFDTRDIGFFDETHSLHVVGRDSRTIDNTDFKMNLDYMEEKLLNLGKFKEVAIVPLHKGNDQLPVLLCTPKNEFKDMSLAEINQQSQMVFGLYEMPVKTIIVDKLPSLPSGKIDYQTLEYVVNQLSGLNSGRISYNVLATAAGVPNEQAQKGPELTLKP